MVKVVKRRCLVMVFLFGISVYLGNISMVYAAGDATEVFVDPVLLAVGQGEDFIVNISCIPGEGIRAFELKVSFDPTVLSATGVFEGDIFSGFSTFFNAGTIDNVAGTIVDIYDLIIGPGAVTDSGVLVSIAFTSKMVVGSSCIDLYDVGVTNDSAYVTVNVSNGIVLVNTTNNPPNTPSVPTGPTAIGTGVSDDFSTSCTDPDNDLVQYRFDWGDGRISDWTGFVASGMSGNISNFWNDTGNYSVRAQARDEFGFVSGWSVGLSVMVAAANLPPYPPGSPSPADGAINILTSVDLSWSGGDPNGDIVSYDVYCGRSNPPMKLTSNISDIIYDPGGLSSGVMYYWYIVAWDPEGASTTGSIWSFRTKSSSSGGGGGGGVPPPPINNTNVPPEMPLIPSGAAMVVVGNVRYYTSSTYDLDNDLIRYRFDWGEGTLSNWSDYVASNTTVTRGFSWVVVGNYSVRVIAQDDTGLNSSWSLALEVQVVDQIDDGTLPVASIFSPPTAVINQSILFDGSGCYDPDGEIVSYYWDFGDGTTATGISPIHMYSSPGEYVVVLTVVDDQGNSVYAEFLMTIPLGSEVTGLDEQEYDVVEYLWLGGMCVLAGAVIVLGFHYRMNIHLFILRLQMHRSMHVSHGPRVAFFKRKDVDIKKDNKPELAEKKPGGKYSAIDSLFYRAGSVEYEHGEELRVFEKPTEDKTYLGEFQVESKVDQIIREHAQRRCFDIDEVVDRAIARQQSRRYGVVMSREIMDIAQQIDSAIINQINRKIDEMHD